MTYKFKHIKKDVESDIRQDFDKLIRNFKNTLIYDLKGFEKYPYLQKRLNKVLDILDNLNKILLS